MDGARGYIRGVPTPHIPLWLRASMITAFIAAVGAWAWVAHKLIYEWLPVWLTDIMLVVGLSWAGYILIRDRLRLRRVQLRGPGLPGSPE